MQLCQKTQFDRLASYHFHNFQFNFFNSSILHRTLKHSSSIEWNKIGYTYVHVYTQISQQKFIKKRMKFYFFIFSSRWLPSIVIGHQLVFLGVLLVSIWVSVSSLRISCSLILVISSRSVVMMLIWSSCWSVIWMLGAMAVVVPVSMWTSTCKISMPVTMWSRE